MADCVFCGIVAGRNPAAIEHEDERSWPSRTSIPRPVHLLIIPKRHIASVMALAPEDAPLVGRLVLAAKRIGEARGSANEGTGSRSTADPRAARSSDHLHLHFLAGRREDRKVERR
jgi:histidine triad (HIT) family protein